LDAVLRRKITSPYRKLNPQIIQPVAQRYTAELSRLHFKHRQETIQQKIPLPPRYIRRDNTTKSRNKEEMEQKRALRKQNNDDTAKVITEKERF
jgi:hypothetical protein